jgi:vancomycin resistance protein YoaR
MFLCLSCNSPTPRLQKEKENISPIKSSELPLQAKDSDRLPWEDDQSFKEMKAKYNKLILIARYKATLSDPLPGEMFNVGHAAQKLAGTIVAPGEIFSQNHKVGPYSAENGFKSGPMYRGTTIVTSVGGGVCKIASLLYNLTVQSNLPVVERHCHSMTVPYVPPGQDATVCYGAKDYRFMNDTKGPILIWAKTVDKTLYMAFYGEQKPPKVTWHHEILKQIDFWTIYKYNNQLPKGEEKIIIPGQDGYVVKSWNTVEYPDGKKETKNRGKSYYNPLPQVIEKGTAKA